MKKTIILSNIIIIIIFILAGDILAIPAFARKYNMTCKTCHSPFPKLKPYGDEFAGNGFVLKNQDAPRYFVDTGDPELSLIRDLPLALRLEGYVTYNQVKSEKSDFNTPLLFKLLSGGAITNNVSYYLYYILENGERGKIEDAWIMFNNIFGSELDVTVGQFQMCDPLFKRELRLTKDDYFIYKVKPGASNIDLTYDRGIMLAYGFETGTDIILEIVNGNGIGEGVSGLFDDDKYKNIMGRVSQDLSEHIRIGAMGYYGKEFREFEHVTTGINSLNNELYMLGGDATISFEPIELNLQYVERNDNDPFFHNSQEIGYPIDLKTRGAFAELIYTPNGDDSKWYAVGLFNWIESDFSELNYKTLSGHLGYVLKRNVRLVAEYTHNFTEEYGKIGIGFITAF